MSAAPGCEFPNPCPVCGDDDDHAEWRKEAFSSPEMQYACTVCPHPREPGHGTGCCCAGRSKPLLAYSLAELGALPSPPLPGARPTLEQRVAALESAIERLEHPLMVVEAPPQPEWTDRQATELREAFETAAMGAPRPLILPSSLTVLDPETIRALLRESVTVVKPGEVLFFTVGDPNCTPNQLRDMQEVISTWLEYNAPDVKALILPHGEMAAAESGPD